MKSYYLLILFLVSLQSQGQLSDSEIRDLKRGRAVDDSSFVFTLPYENGKRYLFVQGANSKFSHKGELSFDFKMAKGTKICAVRGGVVIATKSDSDKGGLKDEYLDDGNHIIIRHADGSFAHYWHLEQNWVFVSPGDTVVKGQTIGASGNTGYSAFPHLHFQLFDAGGKEILPRFKTSKGVVYLRPGRWYKSTNN